MNIAGTLSDTDVLCSGGVPQGYILIPVLVFLLIINDLLSTWKNRNSLFADDATWHAILDPQFWLIFSVNNCMTGWCIWLVQLIRSTTRPVLGSDASSMWNFCALSSRPLVGCEHCRHFIWYRRIVFRWCSSGLHFDPCPRLLINNQRPALNLKK